MANNSTKRKAPIKFVGRDFESEKEANEWLSDNITDEGTHFLLISKTESTPSVYQIFIRVDES